MSAPKSYQQILGGMMSRLTARLGIRKLKPGSGLLTTLEAAAQADARASQDIFKNSQVDDIDNATGINLDRIGIKEKVPRRAKKQAQGVVTIGDSAVTKLFTYIYAGSSAPIVGSLTLYAAKGGTFDIANTTGQVYLGRGTSNYEGPISYTNKVDSGSFWTITLASPTTRFHNWGESVILAQGGSRAISSGQLVSTTQGALTSPQTYVLTQSVNIPDGESEVEGVTIVASTAGENSNVPTGSIVTFQGSAPFPTATITNPNPLTSGRNTEADFEYRERIKEFINDRQTGTDTAVKNASIDVSSAEEGASVLSSSLVRYKDSPDILYIDDGNGYEAKAQGVGYEVIVAQANGGEKQFQTVFSPIAQAYVETTTDAPFVLNDGSPLTVVVGGVATTHYFDTDVFSTPSAASAFEVASSINSNHLLSFAARTTDGGTKVALYSKSESNDDIRVVTTGTDANQIFLFPTSQTSTITLYKNDVLLQKDGVLAQLTSNPFATWEPLLTSETLTINIDDTSNVTYTISDADFYAAGHGALNNASTDVWAEILNRKIPGITATAAYDRLMITSNRDRSNLAKLQIVSGTLVSKKVFSVGTSQGIANDYSIDRAVGTILLNSALEANDRLTLGTIWPEGFVQSTVGNTPFTLSSNKSYWFVADDLNSEVVPSSEADYIAFSAITPTTTHPISTTSNIVQLSNVSVASSLAGDWVLFSDPSFSALPTWYNKPYRILKDYSLGSTNLFVEKAGCHTTRFAHTATLIADNKVLLCGGLQVVGEGIGLPGSIKGRGCTNKAEIYDPATGIWEAVPNMINYRSYHTATLLTNGNVFVCGGFDADGTILNTTEIFNTSAKTWSAGPTMADARAHHTATKLASGNVLIVGGASGATLGSSAWAMSTEYNGSTFVNTAVMIAPRYGHQAVLISGGDVLVFGGISTVTNPAVPVVSCERYLAGSSTWQARTDMGAARAFFGATLSGSNVIVAGNTRRFGVTNACTSNITTNPNQTNWQLYNPGANTWGSVTTFYNATNYGGSGGSLWNQGDLVTSYTTGNVIAGNAMTAVSGTLTGRVRSLFYDAGAGGWNPKYTTAPLNAIIRGREGHVGVAFNSGSLNDSVAWFGGISTVSSVDWGGGTDFFDVDLNPIGSVEILNTVADTFSTPFSGFSSVTLNERRFPIVRTDNNLEQIVIPTGTDYTTSSFTDAFNANEAAIVADVYQTTKARAFTKSYDGSTLLVDKDTSIPSFALNKQNILSQPSQTATVTTAGGAPQNFQIFTVTSNDTTLNVPVPSNDFGYDPFVLAPSGRLKGLKSYTTGVTSATIQETFGNVKGVTSTVSSFTDLGRSVDVSDRPFSYGYEIGVRSTFDVIPGNPAYIADYFKFVPSDTVAITVDQNTQTQRFVVPMARKVIPATGTYQSPLSLKDADNNNATLATAFGLAYNFDDFAILARARCVTDPSDANKRTVWRYNRYGAEGNYVSIRYVYPSEPDQALTVRQNSIQSPTYEGDNYYLDGKVQTIVDVVLNSGALISNRYLSNNTRLGFIKTSPSLDQTAFDGCIVCGFKVMSAARGGSMGSPAVTVLTIDKPAPFTRLGISAGDVLWFNATAPSSSTLQSGQFKVGSVTNYSTYEEITIPPSILNDGTALPSVANPGEVSFDSTQAAKFDTNIQVNNIVRLDISSGAVVNSSPMRITSIGTTNQQLFVRMQSNDSTTNTVPTFFDTYSDSWFKVYSGATKTAAQIAAAVNAITNSSVSAVSAGTSVISVATWDQEDSAKALFQLEDGINYVSDTNEPGTLATQTTFDLKLPVSANLVSNSDYANEIFYLSPILPKSVAQWFNTPAVTGLWTSADIVTSSNGEKVQIKSKTPGTDGSIQVEGGGANLATCVVRGLAQRSNYNTNSEIASLILTTTTGEAVSFSGDTQVVLQNQFNHIKVSDDTSTWGDNNAIRSISKDGLITFDDPIQVLFNGFNDYTPTTITCTFEKFGDFVAVHFSRLSNKNETNLLKVKAGDYVDLISYTPLGVLVASNSGNFRIMRVSTTSQYVTVWIENPSAVEGFCLGGASFRRDDSIVPGDKLIINTTDFGEANFGEWTVLSVGSSSMYVDVSQKIPSDWDGNVDTTVDLLYVTTGTPMKGIRKLLSIAPNNNDTSLSDLLLSDEVSDASLSHPDHIVPWGETFGTVISSINKLGFTQNLIKGVDAYKYNWGLISEVKRVIYGDEADRSNYPGYVSNGASIMIQGPTIKRIQLSLGVRLNGNASDIVGAIKNAVAAVINSSKVGVSIPISDVVAAAAAVGGVSAVSVIAPSYSATADLIVVKGDEKPMIIDLDSDISVVING